MTSDVTPHNLVAERNLLGAMLVSSAAIDVAHRLVTADEFYAVAHKTTFATCVDLWLSGTAVDFVSVSEANRRLDPDVPRLTSAEMRDMQAVGIGERAVTRYAEIVADHAALRQLQSIGQRIHDAARDLAEPAELVEEAKGWIDSAYTPTGDEPPGPDIDTFLAEKIHTDWLVPDFLERGERVILTGGEGRGKVRPCVRQGCRWRQGSSRSRLCVRVSRCG